MRKFNKMKYIQLGIYCLFAIIAILISFLGEGWGLNAYSTSMVLFIYIIVGILFVIYDLRFSSNHEKDYAGLNLDIFTDPTTGIANRYSCDAFIQQYMDKPLPADIGCITFDITNIGEINKTSHEAGNTAIKSFSTILQACSINICFVGRNGGAKFLAIFTKCNDKKLDEFLENVDAKLQKFNQNSPYAPIHYSYGSAFNEGDDIKEITQLIALSNKRSYEAGLVNEI